ncbi:hypothetical protein MHZ90_21800 [Pantoea sp. ACRSH]|uniref:hypothetical protein n=1 Tax=unclassified Pantoea TaxID=2630326 RepID=UPI001EF421F9|nr:MULTISPECIES: hypothetical protein [unclassified Pantoea]MCG7368725.1 hypothetical protein [Pantoea sp. ACRSH]MCG7399117.1 hypothetical protein [Pantoea sp. ACRSC]
MSNQEKSILDGVDFAEIEAMAAAEPVPPLVSVELLPETDATLATDADIADALAAVTAVDPSASAPGLLHNQSAARGVGSITHRSGGKVTSQRVEFVVAKMDEAKELRQQLLAEGKLTEHPNFEQDMLAIVSPTAIRNSLRSNADINAQLSEVERMPGTRASYPHMANAKEDVAQTILAMCRNPADAEMIAAIASCLPDYMRHQQKQRHLFAVQEAHAEAVDKHVASEMRAALKRLEFRSGILTAGGDAQLAQDLAAWQERGNKLSIKSNLSAAPHLIPLLPFHDAKELEQVLCEIAQYIPDNGHRFKAVVLAPDARHRAAETYEDANAAPEGFTRAELSFGFTRVDASTVHIEVRERVLNASTWSPAADLNPFVLVAAWDVYGAENCTGQISPDTGKVRKVQADNLAFLKEEAEKAGAVFEFPAHWQALTSAAARLS